MFPHEVQKIISSYLIFGFLPLDKVLHFFVGLIITIALRWRNVGINKILILIAVLELVKEVHDSFVLNNTLEEHLLDAITTFIYPGLIWLIIRAKRSAQSK